MPTPSVGTAAPPRFRLQTLGTFRLVNAEAETVLGDHGHQRRRLALLAALAASGEHGRSRDQLVGLFWPEVSQARARHSLDQLLYELRTSLDGKLFTPGNPVQLNAAVIDSDIRQFWEALERGELREAVALYRGPFLDGFYLSDAPGFEQWVDTERARAERQYTDALERLAKALEDANDPSAGVPLLQKLVDTDPLSAKHAARLIRTLAKAGDHASALRYAERYETLVQRELGTSVGPAVAELVAEVRELARTESVVVRGVASPTASPASTQRVGETPAPQAPGGLTSEPVDLEARGVGRPTSPVALQKRMPRAGIVIAALAALVVVALRFRPGAAGSAPLMSAPSATPISIAVLPLVNRGADPRDATMADAMTEALIGRLGQIRGLRVIGSTSVFALQNRGMDVRRIADTLGVAEVLEGSLQKSGSRLRVQVRLVDARDGSTRWSDTYEPELRDVFDVQDDIARAVVQKLGFRTGAVATPPLRRPPTQNVAAYELYVRGSDRTLLRSDSSVRVGIGLFQQAIALDSTYAGAWAGLGRLYVRLSGAVPAGERPRYYTLADEAARTAVRLDDSLAEAHATLGAIHLATFDFPSAERELTRAIALDPSRAVPHQWMATLLFWTGRPAEALTHAQRALELDPMSPDARAEVARALLHNDRCGEALENLAPLFALKPPLLRVSPIATQCYAREQRWTEAIALLRPRAERGDAPSLALLGFMLARSGQREEALRVRATLLGRWQKRDVGAFWMALVATGLGERKATCEWLDQSFADHSISSGPGEPLDIMMGPLFEDMHGESCFSLVRKRLFVRHA